MKAQTSILALLPVAALAVQYPTGAGIRNVGFAGTGCSGGQASYTFDQDGGLTIVTPSFDAAAGPSVAIRDQRAACSLSIDVSYPTGYQFALQSAQIYGTANLASGVSAEQSGRIFFSGVKPVSTWSREFSGPFNRGYFSNYTEPNTSRLNWSACGANGQAESTLVITGAANVDTGAGNGKITVDRSRFFITWRTC